MKRNYQLPVVYFSFQHTFPQQIEYHDFKRKENKILTEKMGVPTSIQGALKSS